MFRKYDKKVPDGSPHFRMFAGDSSGSFRNWYRRSSGYSRQNLAQQDRRTSGCAQIVPEELGGFWSSSFAIEAEREQKHVAANPDDQPK